MLILNTSTVWKRYLVAYTVRGFASLANDEKFSLGSILGLEKSIFYRSYAGGKCGWNKVVSCMR